MAEDMDVMQAAIQKMRWHEARQKELAKNIANADTPGYKPQDIAPLDFKGLVESASSHASLTMAQTEGGHSLGLNGGSGGSAQAFAPKPMKTDYMATPTGNNVSMEEQLLKMNENYTDHSLTTTIYQKNIAMLKKAISGQ